MRTTVPTGSPPWWGLRLRERFFAPCNHPPPLRNSTPRGFQLASSNTSTTSRCPVKETSHNIAAELVVHKQEEVVSRVHKRMPSPPGMMSSFLARRWLLLLYLVLGVNAAVYIRPAARPLLNNGEVSRRGVTGQPEQVRVSLAGDHHIKVTWITTNSKAPSIVEYGRTPGRYESSATGSKESYMFMLYRSGDIHSVVLGPLENNTVYYYRCGGAEKEFSLRTPPTTLPVTFAVVGDIGQTEWTVSTLEHVQRSNYDTLLFAGDLSYADYYQPRWDSFGRLVEPSASSRPWMVTEGNHEIERLLLSGSFRAYNARWRMPYELSGSDSNLYYSFEAAGSHVLMLGSYADYKKGSPQYRWLEADLARVDRKKTPWLIAVLHAPWYNSNYAHQREGDEMMKEIEPLLVAANTDILFAGHVHAYERWDRMYNGTQDERGIVHVTIGDGGNREGLAKSFVHPQPRGSLFREASFGHGQLKVVNSTHAHWSWHRNDDEQDTAGDQVWLVSKSWCSNIRQRL